MLKVALVGFGGIAASHRRGYPKFEAMGKIKFVCACDINPEAFTKRQSINISTDDGGVEEDIRRYTDLDEMIAKEEIDFFDVCVPTFLHKEITTKLLRLGYPVLCEKPMSLTYDDCCEMIAASKESGKPLMIGQCLRFYPEFDYIKEVIDSGRYGKVIGAFFHRLSPPPVWGWENWFMDPARSGGCITDLHVHDIDIIRYLFGEPDAVSCRTSTSICLHDTVHSSLFYGDVPVTAVGDWTLAGVPFRAESRIQFEKATIVFDNDLTVYPKDGESFKVPLEAVSAYGEEVGFFADVVTGEIENKKNTAESAASTIRLVECLRKSADANGAITPLK